jgi:hypothetical protein
MSVNLIGCLRSLIALNGCNDRYQDGLDNKETVGYKTLLQHIWQKTKI